MAKVGLMVIADPRITRYVEEMGIGSRVDEELREHGFEVVGWTT